MRQPLVRVSGRFVVVATSLVACLATAVFAAPASARLSAYSGYEYTLRYKGGGSFTSDSSINYTDPSAQITRVGTDHKSASLSWDLESQVDLPAAPDPFTFAEPYGGQPMRVSGTVSSNGSYQESSPSDGVYMSDKHSCTEPLNLFGGPRGGGISQDATWFFAGRQAPRQIPVTISFGRIETSFPGDGSNVCGPGPDPRQFGASAQDTTSAFTVASGDLARRMIVRRFTHTDVTPSTANLACRWTDAPATCASKFTWNGTLTLTKVCKGYIEYNGSPPEPNAVMAHCGKRPRRLPPLF